MFYTTARCYGINVQVTGICVFLSAARVGIITLSQVILGRENDPVQESVIKAFTPKGNLLLEGLAGTGQ